MDPDSRFYTRAEVKTAARGRWLEILPRFGVDASRLRNVHGPCPGCGGRDRFRFDDVGGDGSFLCSQGGGGLLAGDGIALLEHCTGWDWKKVLAELGGYLLPQGGSGRASSVPELNPGVAPAPAAKLEKRPEIDRAKVLDFVRGVPAVDEDFLRRRSRLDVADLEAVDFLEAIYAPGERVLVFASQWSQGDFLHEVGRGSFRLAAQRGVKAVPSALPRAGKEGIWFLNQPVTGQWCIKPGTEEREAQWTRRSWPTVTSWRHYVLESDVLEPELWLRVLAVLPLPLVAIYTSGGRSVHALLRSEVPSKAAWDAQRDGLREILCPLGADPAALSAVRLTRLPSCLREGKKDSAGHFMRFPTPRLQTLLYLNPSPSAVPIATMKEVRA